MNHLGPIIFRLGENSYGPDTTKEDGNFSFHLSECFLECFYRIGIDGI
jgi:hypothetical protein